MATTPTEDATSDAKDAVEHFIDEIIEELIGDGEAHKELHRYSDSYLDENLNQSYSLLEAAQILDDLSDYEETDSGLWEGSDDPQEAVKTQAIFTYRNAVTSYFEGEMDSVNDEVQDVANDLTAERTSLDEQVEALEALDEPDNAQESRLDALRIELEAFDVHRKKRLKSLILQAIGRETKPRGPKDWHPRAR